MPPVQPKNAGAPWCALVSCLTALLLVPGCLVDLDNRCGEHERYDAEQGICLCSGDYALVGNRCEACGEHETGSPDGCVCVDGFSRPTPDADCQELAGLGQDCQSDADCGDPSYGYCYVASSDAPGYCTSTDCNTAADCPTNYGCNTRQSPAFCERPPVGTGDDCKSDADCAGKAASYCEVVAFHACAVNDCKPDPSKCHGDWVCCDIGLLSQSLCVPPDALEDGNCPAGGTLVPRTEGTP
jgi:hypothetical protein